MLFQLLRGNFDFTSIVAEILAVLLIVFLILPFHEWAHAFTASLLGDKAIKYRGRLSLNPLSHIDPMGSLCLLLFGFGWAKPVPVDPRNFKNPKVGMAVTAIMGPIANLLAAFAGLLIYNALFYLAFGFLITDIGGFVRTFLSFYISCNIGLAVFNLIPIPPLDGSRILAMVLPDKAYEKYFRYERIIMIVLIVLLFTGILNAPISFLVNLFMKVVLFIPELIFGI